MSETLETKREADPTDIRVSEKAEKKKEMVGRAEIDTSAPFESVKEAVCRFGGSAVWKSHISPKGLGPENQRSFEEVDIAKVEQQTSLLEKDLILKERETLEVLKELEATKRIVDELKSKLQKEASEVVTAPEKNSYNLTSTHGTQTEKPSEDPHTHFNSADMSMGSIPSAGVILMELKQAKVNLSRTTSDLGGIRAFVESLNMKLEKEKRSLEKTRERLTSNSAKIAVLEEELNKTRLKLQLAKDIEVKRNENPSDISRDIQQLCSEAEQFKKMAEAAKLEVSKTMAEIKQSKTSIRTGEIRWHAAKKMEEAAKAAEAVALADIKALTSSEKSVTLSYEEYVTLTSKAHEAEEISKRKIEAAMIEVDEAEICKREIQKKVEEASEEVNCSRKALEEALNRVEAANRGKLAVEEALRKWRSEHGQKRRSFHNSTKFKNSGPSQHRRDSRLLDLNGISMNMSRDGSDRVLRPTLSIGQILSRKLLLPEEYEYEVGVLEKSSGKPKVSLGQMLGKRGGVLSPPRCDRDMGAHKQFSAKRKKFGFARLTLLLAKQNKMKKKQGHKSR